MQKYLDLESPDYNTVTVESYDTDQSASSGDPAYTAPNHFLFSGLGQDREGKVELHLQIGEFAEGGFNGIPPEAVLLALREHYAGLNRSDLACRDFNSVVGLLDDAIQTLKGVNDRRNYYGIYGTIKPE